MDDDSFIHSSFIHQYALQALSLAVNARKYGNIMYSTTERTTSKSTDVLSPLFFSHQKIHTEVCE